MPESHKRAQVKDWKGEIDPDVLFYMDLVNKIRESKKSDVINAAFRQIIDKMDCKIRKIVGKFRIPGFSFDDIYQEAMIALQCKAIRDYDVTRGKDPTKPAAFDRFALLCIRRHLATTLKTSKQNRHSALNLSRSLDADQSNDNEELSLINIVCKDNSDDVVTLLQKQEIFKLLVNRLLPKLSSFEKKVFYLYARQYSYDEIADLINRRYGNSGDVNIKGIDNALSRIKNKAKLIAERLVLSEKRKSKSGKKNKSKTRKDKM